MPTIQANGITLNYRFDGPEDAPVVLMSDSLAADHTMWDPQVPALAAAGRRVLRYDSRGHGRSSVPAGPYPMETLAADAIALLDALGIARVNFIGCSKGGMVGQMLATHHGDRLERVVLASTAAKVGPPEVWTQRIETVRSSGMEAVTDATIERWFTAVGREKLPVEVARVRDMVAATPVEGYCASAEGIRDMDQRESIRAVEVPTLVIVGEEDQGTPVCAAELIHERIAGSRLVVLEACSHFANVERADAFNAACLEFLSGAHG